MEPVKKEKNTEGSSVFDAKAFESALIAQVKAAGGTKEFLKGGDFIQNLVKSAFQSLLNVEMDEHLGYEKHDRSEGTNARNGKKSKTIRGDCGEVEIEAP
jgi:transposase-like protein